MPRRPLDNDGSIAKDIKVFTKAIFLREFMCGTLLRYCGWLAARKDGFGSRD
jgi:hypothetical protein